MAVGNEYTPVREFTDWYVDYEVDERDGTLGRSALDKCASSLRAKFENYKREMDTRVANYWKLVKLADAEVLTTKPDLPNVSSGETAGMIRRMARNLVQNTPNVEVISEFSDEDPKGIFTKHILKTKIIGDDLYANDMQQNLFASTKNSLTLGYDCVIPSLRQDAGGGWKIEYDNVYYRDVFPEPGAKDIRKATDVFVRRYLTKGEAHALVRGQVTGWDVAALKTMLKSAPRPKREESTDQQTKKHGSRPEGYEVITWYSDGGEPFLTFDESTGVLLRIEKNKHPLKWHPVFFLVLEKDLNQPLGKSQVELVLGRQEFQDLMLNGAMKMWYRNINPPLIGYGTMNAVPNLGPGKYTSISNPNAKVEAFEVNTQTLLQYNSIAQGNAGNMGQLIGAADQQMAAQSTGGMMSQTPQGVEAQQAMVDITTNNYQKAIESFFSRYCSYALTIFFAELKTFRSISPTADAREALIAAGMDASSFDPVTHEMKINFEKLNTEYFVRTVPGSLVEMEDEKQIRILNELFIPLSQGMGAISQSGNTEALNASVAALQFIIQRQIELSGAANSKDIASLWSTGAKSKTPEEIAADEKLDTETNELLSEEQEAEKAAMVQTIANLQEQTSTIRESMDLILGHLGIPNTQSASEPTVTAV